MRLDAASISLSFKSRRRLLGSVGNPIILLPEKKAVEQSSQTG